MRRTRASIAFAIALGAGGCRTESADAETLAAGMKAKMTLPVQVDADTRLDDVRAVAKKELGYFLTLTTMTKAKVDANPSFAGLLESNLRGGACANPNYVKLFKAGISVRVVYQTQDGVEVRKIALAPKDCGL